MQFSSENGPRTSETVSLLAFNMYYSYATEFFAHGTNVYMCTRVHPHVHAHVRSYPSNSRIIAFVIVEMDEGGDRRGGKPRTIKTLSEKKRLRRQRNLRYRQKMTVVNVTIHDAVDIRRIGDKEGMSDRQVVTL